LRANIQPSKHPTKPDRRAPASWDARVALRDRTMIRDARAPASTLLLRLDAGLADDAAELVVLPAHLRAELIAAQADRAQAVGGELRPDAGVLPRGGEPPPEPRRHLGRRLGRREQPVPDLGFVPLVAGLVDRRHVRQRLRSRAPARGQRAQGTGLD